MVRVVVQKVQKLLYVRVPAHVERIVVDVDHNVLRGLFLQILLEKALARRAGSLPTQGITGTPESRRPHRRLESLGA